MQKSVICDDPSTTMTSYADDSTFHVLAKNINSLKFKLESLSSRMISYCQTTGLVLNSDKTQLLVSPKQKCQINVGSCLISASTEINLLGVDFDSNFSTAPYLHKLARSANTRAALIHRLSFSMPPHLLTMFANGLLMGKILSASPVTIPVRLNSDDRSCIVVTEEINRSIKSTARTITRTKLSDKVRSEDVLKKANLKCLNECVASITAVTVWKAKQSMNPLGKRLFKERTSNRYTWSETSKQIRPPVPGFPNLVSNIMVEIWNTVPELQSALTLSAAKEISRKWARGIPR